MALKGLFFTWIVGRTDALMSTRSMSRNLIGRHKIISTHVLAQALRHANKMSSQEDKMLSFVRHEDNITSSFLPPRITVVSLGLFELKKRTNFHRPYVTTRFWPFLCVLPLCQPRGRDPHHNNHNTPLCRSLSLHFRSKTDMNYRPSKRHVVLPARCVRSPPYHAFLRDMSDHKSVRLPGDDGEITEEEEVLKLALAIPSLHDEVENDDYDVIKANGACFVATKNNMSPSKDGNKYFALSNVKRMMEPSTFKPTNFFVSSSTPCKAQEESKDVLYATYGMTMLCLSSPTHGRSPRFYDEPNLKGGGSTTPSQKAHEPTIPVTTRIRQVTKDDNDGSILQTPPRKRLRRMPLSNIDSPPPIIPTSENRWSSSSLSSSSLSSIVATTTTTTTSSHPFPSSQGIFPSSNRTREETSGWCASMMTLNPRQPLLLPPPPPPPATLEWTGRTSHIIWLRPRPVKLNHRDGILDETLFGSTKNSHSLLIPS